MKEFYGTRIAYAMHSKDLSNCSEEVFSKSSEENVGH